MKTLVLAACVAAFTGCAGHEHLGPQQGVATRAAFRAQVIHPAAGGEARPDPGLDPQEAAIVSDTYYKSLAPAKTHVPKAPTLIIEDPEQAKLPPPMGGPK